MVVRAVKLEFVYKIVEIVFLMFYVTIIRENHNMLNELNSDKNNKFWKIKLKNIYYENLWRTLYAQVDD